MFTIGPTEQKVKYPTDKIRQRWISEFDENKNFIAHRVAKYIAKRILPLFLREYYNGYCESPKRKHPLIHSQKITPQSVFKILTRKQIPRKRLAPLKEWRKEFAKLNEPDINFFQKLMGSLTVRIAEILPKKLNKAFKEHKLRNVKHKSRLEWNSVDYTVHSKMWLHGKFVPPKIISSEQSKWTKEFDKHVATTAGKIALAFLEQVRNDLKQRKDDPYATHPSKIKLVKFDLRFAEALLLIKDCLAEDKIVSPFNHWIKCLETEFPRNTDFHYFKDKISILFTKVNSWIKNQKKELVKEGICLETKLVDNSHHYSYILSYHTI